MELTRPSVKWFVETQSDWFCQNGIPDWFHGIITRREAEALLHNKTPGCFLIRVGESRIGYSLSYVTTNCYRHFMIDVLEGQKCHISGDTRIHNSLQDLVKFHTLFPICPYNEILTQACGQKSNSSTDYDELFKNKDNQVTNFQHTNLIQNQVPLPVSTPVFNGAQSKITRTDLNHFTPPVPPRRFKSADAIPQLPEVPSEFPCVPVTRLYPSLSQVSVLPYGQVHCAISNTMVLGPHTNPPKTSPHSSNPSKGSRNLLAKAVSLVTDGQNTINSGCSGQPTPKPNTRNKLAPEEYKKPPPFAPGFC
ncbi:hematopoietic SH2 domain-containing protein-like [Pelodytes ibericus]